MMQVSRVNNYSNYNFYGRKKCSNLVSNMKKHSETVVEHDNSKQNNHLWKYVRALALASAIVVSSSCTDKEYENRRNTYCEAILETEEKDNNYDFSGIKKVEIRELLEKDQNILHNYLENLRNEVLSEKYPRYDDVKESYNHIMQHINYFKMLEQNITVINAKTANIEKELSEEEINNLFSNIENFNRIKGILCNLQEDLNNIPERTKLIRLFPQDRDKLLINTENKEQILNDLIKTIAGKDFTQDEIVSPTDNRVYQDICSFNNNFKNLAEASNAFGIVYKNIISTNDVLLKNAQNDVNEEYDWGGDIFMFCNLFSVDNQYIVYANHNFGVTVSNMYNYLELIQIMQKSINHLTRGDIGSGNKEKSDIPLSEGEIKVKRLIEDCDRMVKTSEQLKRIKEPVLPPPPKAEKPRNDGHGIDGGPGWLFWALFFGAFL